METEVDQMLLNLKNIAELKEGDKLRIAADNLLEVDASFLPTLSRAYNGDSRHATLEKLEGLFREIFLFIERVIRDSAEPDGLFAPNVVQLLQRFQVALRCALTGLENLRQTYHADITTRSTLTLLIEKIKIKADKLDSRLHL